MRVSPLGGDWIVSEDKQCADRGLGNVRDFGWVFIKCVSRTRAWK